MSNRKILLNDGVHVQEAVHQPSENKLYVYTHQPQKRKIYKANKRDANNSEAHTKMRLALRIPEDDFAMACTQYPDFVRGTTEEQLRAIERMAKDHPEWVRVTPRQRIFPNARR